MSPNIIMAPLCMAVAWLPDSKEHCGNCLCSAVLNIYKAWIVIRRFVVMEIKMMTTGNKISLFEAAEVQVTAGGRLAERSMNIHRKRPQGGETQLTNPINYQTITTD